jgi:hypothetical protein
VRYGLLIYSDYGSPDDFSDFSGFHSMFATLLVDTTDEPVGRCRSTIDFDRWFALPPTCATNSLRSLPSFFTGEASAYLPLSNSHFPCRCGVIHRIHFGG